MRDKRMNEEGEGDREGEKREARMSSLKSGQPHLECTAAVVCRRKKMLHCMHRTCKISLAG